MEKFDEYNRYRNLLHRIIQKATRNYYNDLLPDNKNNSSKLWKIMYSLNNIKIKQNSPPKKLHNCDSNVL